MSLAPFATDPSLIARILVPFLRIIPTEQHHSLLFLGPLDSRRRIHYLCLCRVSRNPLAESQAVVHPLGARPLHGRRIYNPGHQSRFVALPIPGGFDRAICVGLYRVVGSSILCALNLQEMFEYFVQTE